MAQTMPKSQQTTMAYLVDSFINLDKCLKALPVTTKFESFKINDLEHIEEEDHDLDYEASSSSHASASQISSYEHLHSSEQSETQLLSQQ